MKIKLNLSMKQTGITPGWSNYSQKNRRIPILRIFILLLVLPVCSSADSFKFKLRNTDKASVTVFYKITRKSGKFKLKALVNLKAGEEKIKDVSIGKGDTISFYGQ